MTGDGDIVTAGAAGAGTYARRPLHDSRYREIAELSPTLLFTAGADGRIDFVNARWSELTGEPAAALLDEGWIAFVHPEDLAGGARRWRDARRRGTAFHVEWRLRRADGSYRWVQIRAVAACTADGEIERWFGSGADIDEQRRAIDSLRALLDTGAPLGSDADVEATLRSIAEASIGGFADLCVFDLFADGEHGAQVVVSAGDVPAETLAAARATAPPAPQLQTAHPAVVAYLGDAPVFVPVADDAWVSANAPTPAHARAWRETGVHSVIAVPLRASGRAIGSVTLLRTRTPSPFDAGDVPVAQEIGHRAGDAVERARANEAARRLAIDRERQFRRIADSMPQLMWTTSAASRVDWYNHRWTEYAGRTLDAESAAGWWDLVHPLDRALVAERWRFAFESGSLFEVESRIRRWDGRYRWFLTRATPLRDTASGIVTWYGTSTDIDDARAASRVLQTYADLGEALSEAPGIESTLGAVMECVVPMWADWAFITRVDEAGDLRIAATCHDDDAAGGALRALRGAVIVRRRHVGAALDVARERRPIPFDGPEADALREIAERGVFDALRGTGAHTILTVPLMVGTVSRGALCACMSDPGRAFEPADVPFFEELARRVTPAIASADLYERERRVARTFQEAALPVRLPAAAGVEFHAIYEAGRAEALVGGDWYDAFALPDGRIVTSIGDVAGSGLEAAVTMASVRQVIRGVAQVHAEPAVMLRAADGALRAESPDRFVTAFVGIVDVRNGTLTFASAGHSPPFLRRPDGTVEQLFAPALPLGLREDEDVATHVIPMPPGTLLVLYTDGLVESTHDLDEGERRVVAALADDAIAAAPDPARALRDAVLREGGARDDVAILTVAMRP